MLWQRRIRVLDKLPLGIPSSAANQTRLMSQHRSLRATATLGAKRSVLKRYERVELLKKSERWKQGDRVTGLPKTKSAS